MIGLLGVALGAIAGAVVHMNEVLGYIRVTKSGFQHVLTARAVAILALDVGEVLQLRVHGVPIAGLQCLREGPRRNETGRHIVKPPVHCQRIGVVAHDMTIDASRIVMAALDAIDRLREEGGVIGH